MFAAAGAISDAVEALRTQTRPFFKQPNMADNLEIGRPVFATDCQVPLQAISTNSYDDAPLGTLFREVKYILRLPFIDYRVIHPRGWPRMAWEMFSRGFSLNWTPDTGSSASFF